MVQSISPEGKLLFVNQAWLGIMGYTKEEVKSLDMSRIIHPEHMHECSALFMKVMEGHRLKDVETVFMKKDGSKIIVKGDAVPRMMDGKVIATQGFFRDITKEKEAERLKKENDYSELMLNSVSDGLWVLDRQGRTIDVNTAAVKMYGYKDKDELLKKSPAEVTPKNDMAKVAELVKKTMKGKSAAGEIHALRKDRKEFPAFIRTSPRKDKNGKIIGGFASIRDITKQKNFEEQLKKANKDLAQERDMLVTGPVVVFRWQNKEGWPVEYVSSNVKKLIGYSVEEFTSGSTPYADLIPKQDISRVGEEVKIYSAKGVKNFRHKPYRLVRKNGKTIWVLDHTTIIRDSKGNITHYLGYLVDITDIKKVEEKLLKEKNACEMNIDKMMQKKAEKPGRK